MTSTADSADGADPVRPVAEIPPAGAKRGRAKGIRAGAAFAALAVVLYFGGHWLLVDRHRVYTDDAMVDTDQVFVTARIAERVARVAVEQNQFVRRGQLLAVLDDANERAALDLARQNARAMRASARAARDAASLEGETQSAQIAEQGGGVVAAVRSESLSASQTEAALRAVEVARAQVGSARAQLAAARAATPAAEEALRRARADQGRTESLARDGYVAQASVDASATAVSQARAAYEASVAQADASASAVRMAEAGLAQQRALAAAAANGASASAAQIPIARAKRAGAAAPSRVANKLHAADAADSQADAMDAQVRMASLALAETRVVAPVDGWISARNAEEGQTVAPGQSIVTISPARRVFVTANYKETQIDRIRPGMPVDVSLDACGGAKVRGSVVGFAPVAQNALSTLPALSAPTNFVKVTQRVPVRIALPPATGRCVFRPGTAVEVAVIAD